MSARNRTPAQQTPDPARQTPDAAGQNLVVALHSVVLILLGLHFYMRTLPPTPAPIPPPASAEAAWWGFWPITYLPAWAVLAGVIAVVGFIAAFWLVHASRADQAIEAGASQGSSRHLWPVLWLISLALVVAFFLFPIAHTRWGDAFMLAKGIAYPDPALRLTDSWQAPLDVALHSRIWAHFHAAFGWEDAMPVYRLLSPVAGALYLLVVLALSRHPLLAPGWLPYGLFATLGLMQLFFGYVENYSFAAAGVLAYLWLGLAVIEGRRPLWLAATVLALTHATHPSTIVLAPSLLYLGGHLLRTSRAGHDAAPRPSPLAPPRNQTFGVVVLQIALPMLLIGGATFLWMEANEHGVAALLSTDRPGGGDARWFVPLFATTTRWEHYTMFSWPHLRDWLNGQMLVAPIVLPALAMAGMWIVGVARKRVDRDWRLEIRDWRLVGAGASNLQSPISQSQNLSIPTARFLSIATACYLLFTFVWNPDYGGQRDWDLFSLAALPATLLLALLLTSRLRGRELWGAVVPLLLLQGWHTLAWIYQNTLPWQWPD